MADISMCHGEQMTIKENRFVRVPNGAVCPLRDRCRRYTAPRSHRQSMMLGRPMDGSCTDFEDTTPPEDA